MSVIIKNLKQRGDTIIEVVIAIAIIGTVLAGGYATANTSYDNVRDSQYHEEATTIASSQAEILGVQPATPPLPSSFCFNTAVSGLTPIPTPSINCSGQGTNNLFNITITQVGGKPSGNNLSTYEINITWVGVDGNNDDVQLYYQPLLG